MIHYTPERGWINDPNGLICIDGTYHLFCQHYPDAVHWGPMYWGHAVSKDLLHWTHLPIALKPDALGSIFSGSAILDQDNLTGFGDGTVKPLVLVYTNHDMDKELEVQSIAYSCDPDYLRFTAYAGNPVIPGRPKANSRDPKVFPNPVRGGFSLALATEGCVSFYASRDLKKWEKTGEFEAGRNGLSGICECPDCFPVRTAEGTKWVLMVSMIQPDDVLGKPLTPYTRFRQMEQYYVGNFDGNTFYDTQQCEEPLLPDFGTDFYAGVTFSGTKQPMLLGWADNWDYADKAPAAEDGYQGVMTLARKISLRKYRGEYRICQRFAGLPDPFQYPEVTAEQIDLDPDGALDLTAVPEAGARIALGNDLGEELVLSCSNTEWTIDRSCAGKGDFSGKFCSDRTGVIRFPKKLTAGRLRMIFDRSILEMEGDDGLTSAAIDVYPNTPYTKVRMSGLKNCRIGTVR